MVFNVDCLPASWKNLTFSSGAVSGLQVLTATNTSSLVYYVQKESRLFPIDPIISLISLYGQHHTHMYKALLIVVMR